MYKLHHQLRFSDVDSAGYLSPAGAARLTQDCAMFQLNESGRFKDFFQRHQLGCFLVAKQMIFERMPRFNEQVTIETWISSCRNFYGQRNTILRDAEGNPCVICTETGAFVSRSTGKPFVVPAEESADVVSGEPYPMEYAPRRIAVPQDAEFEELERTRVFPMMLDMNQHLNSTFGLELVMKHVTVPYHQLRGEYRAQAELGATLVVDRCMLSDGRCLLRLHNGAGTLFTVHEFTP